MTLLWLVEDDASIGAGLVRTLEAEGHEVAWATTVAAAEALVGTPDLLLLDLGLPDGDGLDVCRRLSERNPQMRTIILTARTGEIDVVLGLDAGAIDYISKPFRLSELLARIRAQMRARSPERIVVGDLSLERGSRRVHLGGMEVPLRPREFDLLARLAVEPGSVVHREVLMTDVWDEHWFGDTKTLDVHIAHLRRRLGEAPGEPSRITTVRGVGYRLEVERR
ncbi:MAG TPA: response regulator transcription factor [Acidimicrobiales bacterium]|jgi:DNA-binding response OmpR family regulator|nr:response regulator transcription factor [Acidimicrobiales bacterium]